MKFYVQHIVWFLSLIALQVLVLDSIQFMGLFLPFVYVYPILHLPANMRTHWVVLVSFMTGMVVDVFSNTPGMHASAATLLGFLRYPVLRLFVLKEDLGMRNVQSEWLGWSVYWKYAALLVLLHHVSLFLLESFTFLHVGLLLIKIPVCFILTLVCIFCFEQFKPRGHATKF